MKFEHFEEVLKLYKSIEEKLSALNKIGLDLYESKYALSDDTCNLMTTTFKSHYTNDGVDWITWFIFEVDYGNKTYNEVVDGKLVKRKYCGYDKNGKKICYSIKSLYNYIQTHHQL